MSEVFEEKYLGDGVYISFDGYQFWLAVGNHENKIVAIDREVYNNMVRAIRSIYGETPK